MNWFSSFQNSHRREQQKDTPLQIEQLETRALMAGDPVLLDIHDGAGSSNPQRFEEMNGFVYFAANDGIYNVELWKSDGTSAGTERVRNINPAGSGNPSNLTNVSGTLFFRANDGNGYELWKSDGTFGGTELVKDLDGSPGNSSLGRFTNVNGTLFFTANDGVHGSELWMSDGTSEGTVLVKDIRPGAVNSLVSDLINVNGTLFFAADDGNSGKELWKTDGTSGGTVLVKDIDPGASGSSPLYLTEMNGTLFFQANDGVTGYELWTSDGTSGGTQLVKDFNDGGDFSPFNFSNVNGTMFFSANGGTAGFELWRSDGTSSGTVMIKDINVGAPYSSPLYITNVNGTAFFQADDGLHDFELWMSDGTSLGTQLVKDIFAGAGDSSPQQLMNVNGTLFFSATDNNGDTELWMSDGSSAGTERVADLREGDDGSTPSNLFNANGTLFFSASDGVNGRELFALDLAVETGLVVTGADAGTPGIVRVFDAPGNEVLNFFPYTQAFTGGVRVATGDINGDGVLDIVTAAGPGGGPHIQVFDTSTGQLITGGVNNFYAYAPHVTSGVFVAVGDVNDDGFDDIITAPDAGGGPHVKVFSGKDGSLINEFYAYAPHVTTGVRVAAGDVTGDHRAEIITAPGAGGGPHVRVFDGASSVGIPIAGPATDFYAYAPNVLTGLYLDVGDVNGDGLGDIITAPGAGGGPHVKVFSSADASLLHDFYAYDPGFTGGVRVALADLTLDGFADLITSPGPGGGPHVKGFNGLDLSSLGDFYSGDPGNTSGLFIAGGVSLFPDDIEQPMLFSLPFENEQKSAEFSIEETNELELVPSFFKKKSWLDDADEFYSQAEEIDKLFSGLGIE
ncbi:Hypothetical protein PBC10988_24240 [Planctomycetales bacterium 10988]|nr:Hypothetical protein PBC10988_24240 [Planctomycetales bacterium 10988]